MPTRNIVLTDHQAAMVLKLVDSGRYQHASEVILEGLRLIERRETEDEARLDAMREAFNIGVADIGAERYHDFDTAESLHDHLSTMTDEALAVRPSRACGNRRWTTANGGPVLPLPPKMIFGTFSAGPRSIPEKPRHAPTPIP